MKKVLVLINSVGESIVSTAGELTSFAALLAGNKLSQVLVVVAGYAGDGVINEFMNTGSDVLHVAPPVGRTFSSDDLKSVFSDAVNEFEPGYICVAHDPQGLDFAPGVAVKTGAACITGVSGVKLENDRMVFTRPVYGGSIETRVVSTADRTVLTILPGTIGNNRETVQNSGELLKKEFSDLSDRVKVIAVKKRKQSVSRLPEADVIVAAGRGIGSAENIEKIRQFSESFRNSAVAGSRPLIDNGWMEYPKQVGLTGAKVAPELYIACGISGSSQHIAGMKDSKFVVAINSDPNAAIFKQADVCIIDNIIEFIERFISTDSR